MKLSAWYKHSVVRLLLVAAIGGIVYLASFFGEQQAFLIVLFIVSTLVGLLCDAYKRIDVLEVMVSDALRSAADVRGQMSKVGTKPRVVPHHEFVAGENGLSANEFYAFSNAVIEAIDRNEIIEGYPVPSDEQIEPPDDERIDPDHPAACILYANNIQGPATRAFGEVLIVRMGIASPFSSAVSLVFLGFRRTPQRVMGPDNVLRYRYEHYKTWRVAQTQITS